MDKTIESKAEDMENVKFFRRIKADLSEMIYKSGYQVVAALFFEKYLILIGTVNLI